MKRWEVVAGMLVIALLAVVPGCSKRVPPRMSRSQKKRRNNSRRCHVSYPTRWTKGGPRAMRVVTYVIPAAEGDSEAAECAVSYFGTAAGGDVEMNIQRWVGQFDGSPAPVRKDDKVNGMDIAKVEISGAYLAPQVR